MQFVPLANTPQQSITTILGGQRVKLSIRWQPLSEAWYLTLDYGDTRVVTARQITPWERLLHQPRTDFAGDLIVLAESQATTEPLGRRAWTETHALWYLTADELEAAGL